MGEVATEGEGFCREMEKEDVHSLQHACGPGRDIHHRHTVFSLLVTARRKTLSS